MVFISDVYDAMEMDSNSSLLIIDTFIKNMLMVAKNIYEIYTVSFMK